LRRHAHLARYRAEEVKGEIVVFEPIGGASPELLESLRKYSPFVGTPNLERLEQRVQHSPVLRFRLVDEETRRFHTSRMTYRGEGGMMPLMRGGGSIEEVAALLRNPRAGLVLRAVLTEPVREHRGSVSSRRAAGP
jgi:hypothetical protein